MQEEQKPQPVRVMNANVPLYAMERDATHGWNWQTPKDAVAQLRVHGVASLVGMMFAGTACGLYTGTDPKISKMIADGAENDEIAKKKESLVPLSSYTYMPCKGADGST